MGFFERLFGKHSLDYFANQIVRGLRKAGQTDELRYEPAEFRIVQLRDGKEVGVIDLGNMYRTHLALERRHRAIHLKHCVSFAMRLNPRPPS